MKDIPEFLSRFNWVDIFVVILALRILYISWKTGFKFESFKVMGTVAAVYLSLHYFSSLGRFYNSRLLNRTSHSIFFDICAFATLFAIGYGVFFLLRLLIGKFAKSEVHVLIDRWGGLLLGACRAALTVSLALCFFLATSKEYFRKSVHGSFSGPYVSAIAPQTYEYFWNSFASKLQRGEQLNPAVSDLSKI